MKIDGFTYNAILLLKTPSPQVVPNKRIKFQGKKFKKEYNTFVTTEFKVDDNVESVKYEVFFSGQLIKEFISAPTNYSGIYHFEKLKTTKSITQRDINNIKKVMVKKKKILITYEQMTQMFPSAKFDRRELVRKLLNKYMPIFKMDTPLIIAHFLAHVYAEVGESLTGNEEDLYYSAKGLKSTFGRYFNYYPSEAEDLGYRRISIRAFNKIPKNQRSKYIKLTKKYAYSKLPDEDGIARRVYACHGNNGYFTLKKGGDKSGSLYRGKGFIQLTWKGNYEAVNNILKRKVPNEKLDIVNKPYSVLQTREGILSALGFWEWQKLNSKAEKGSSPEIVDLITNIVNSKTKSRDKRKQYFAKFYKIMENE